MMTLPYGLVKLNGDVADWAIIELATKRIVARGMWFHAACEALASWNGPALERLRETRKEAKP